jgi:hypothetical protein
MNAEAQTERALIRTIAGASRKLNEDIKLSPLAAIDKLQKLNAKFREQWISYPWLVLADCYTIAANMPVPQMLEEIARHGNPIGIVGMCLLKHSQRYAVLTMMFRKDEKSRKTVAKSGEAATEILASNVRNIRLHEGVNEKK